MMGNGNHRLPENDVRLNGTTPKKSVTIYQSIRHHVTEDCTLSLCANCVTAMFGLDNLQL